MVAGSQTIGRFPDGPRMIERVFGKRIGNPICIVQRDNPKGRPASVQHGKSLPAFDALNNFRQRGPKFLGIYGFLHFTAPFGFHESC
jgi:hypothetical protein